MWLWRHHRVGKKYFFLARLTLFSALFHAAALFAFFFFYRGEEITHVINLDLTHKTIMVMPFHKSTIAFNNGTKVAVPSHISSTVQQAHAAVKTSIITKTDKPAVKKYIKKKDVAKKPMQKKVEAKKIVKEEKLPEQKEEQRPVVNDKEQASPQLQEVGSVSEDNIIYAGQLELDALELSMAIKQELELVWKPPRGIKPVHCCKVKVMVGMDGKAQDITIQESSCILVFDTSVRYALQSMNFPQRSYGKELILPFR